MLPVHLGKTVLNRVIKQEKLISQTVIRILHIFWNAEGGKKEDYPKLIRLKACSHLSIMAQSFILSSFYIMFSVQFNISTL